MITFFLYEKATGIIFLLLPKIPDNDDFETTAQIWHNGSRVASGLKWEKVDYEITQPIDIEPTPRKYLYINNQIQNNPNYQEVE